MFLRCSFFGGGMLAASVTCSGLCTSEVSAGVERFSVGSGANEASLVLTFANDASYIFDVRFDGSINGIDLIQLIEGSTSAWASPFDATIINSSYGAYIDGFSFEGNSNSGYGGGEDWWHYWTRESESDSWTFASIGAGSRTVSAGSWDGWRYGSAAAPIPEPASLALLGLGALVMLRRRY